MTDDKDAILPKKDATALLSDIDAGVTTPLKAVRQGDEWIIAYGFNAKVPALRSPLQRVSDVRPLEAGEQAAVRKIFADIEKVAKVKCIESPDGQGDIRFFKAEIAPLRGASLAPWPFSKLLKPTAELVHDDGKSRSVVADSRWSKDEGTLTHGIMHALGGFSHPNANGMGGMSGGYDKHFSWGNTVLSYNKGGAVKQGLAQLDVEALQRVYGEREPSPGADVFRGQDLARTSIVYAGPDRPVTIDLRGGKYPEGSSLVIETDAGMAGMLEKIAPEFLQEVRLVGGSRIQNVLIDPDARVNVSIIGNALPNILQGGGKNDYIMPRGGGDVMAGGKGADVFDIGSKSGFDNIIADFNTGGGKDKIQLNPPIVTAALKEYKDYPAGGKRQDGTLVTGKDSKGMPVASVFIANASRADVAAAIRHGGDKSYKIEIVMADEEQSPAPDATAPAPTPLSKNSRAPGAGK